MTYTRTFTYEERAWELALEASDPGVAPERRDKSVNELKEWLTEMPEDARKRIAGALRQLAVGRAAEALQNTMPDVF